MNEIGLIESVQAGSREDFDALMDRYHGMVYGLCLRMTGNVPDAEELAHDAFVETFLKLGQLRDPDRFAGWLKTLTLNLCRTWYRRNRREVELNDDLPAPVEEEEDPCIYARMSYGLSRLSAAHRMALVLHYYEDLSYEEISTFLEVPIGTVMSRLHRARHSLKEVLEQMTEEEEIPTIADGRFKEEVNAEIAVLLEMFREQPNAAERLSVILGRSPESLARLIQDTDTPTMLYNLAVLLPRLGSQAVEWALECSFSSDARMQENANAVLRIYVSRCRPVRVKGWPSETASPDAYMLLDRLFLSQGSEWSKSIMLLDLLEACEDGCIAALFMNALLCYRKAAFPLLATRFRAIETDGGRRSDVIRQTLSRTGADFCEVLQNLLFSGKTNEQVLGLYGFEAVARCIDHDLQDASPQQLANAVRIRDRWTPLRREDLDAQLLRQMTERTLTLIHSRDTGVRNAAIRVLGLLKAPEYVEQVIGALQDGELSTRLAAIAALPEIGDVAAVQPLMQTANTGSTAELVSAVKALGRLQADEAESLLAGLASGKDGQVREAAILALGEIGGEAAQSLLQELLRSPDTEVRKVAAKALFGGTSPRKREMSEVERKLAERRRRPSPPVAEMSLDATMRYALPEIRPYEERDLTERIAGVCSDHCATRRHLIEQGLMTRSGGIYEFTPLGETIWRVEHFILDQYLR